MKSPDDRWQSCAEFRKAIKRSAHFKRYRLAATVAMCVFALLAWPAIWLWDKNKTDNASLNAARQLADISSQLVGTDRSSAVLTALESVHAHESVKGQESLLRALTGLGNAGTFLARDVNISALAFSSTGRWLAAAAEDLSQDALVERAFDTGHGDLRIWDVRTGKELFRVPLAGGPLAWSPDGAVVAVATQGQRVAIWDVERAVAKKLDLAPLLSASDSSSGSKTRGQAPKTDVETEENLITRLAEEDAHRGEIPRRLDLETNHDSIVRLAWDPKGVYLAGLTETGEPVHPEVLIWDVKTGRLVRAFPAPDTSMSWIPGTELLAFGTGQGSIETWTINGQRLGATKAAPSGISGIIFSSNAGRVAVIENETVTVRRVDSQQSKPGGSQTAALRVTKEAPLAVDCHAAGDYAIAFNPQGPQLACAQDASVKVMDVEHTPGRLLEEFEMAPSSVISEPDKGAAITWSPDGTKLAFPANGTLRLAEAAAPFVRTLVVSDGQVEGLSWIDDSRIFVASVDDQFRIWDSSRETSATSVQEAVQTGALPKISGRLLYAGRFGLVMLNPDKTLLSRYIKAVPPSRWLVGGSPDGSQLAWLWGSGVQIRDSRDNRLLFSLGGIELLGPVLWSPSGDYLASFTDDGLQIHTAAGRQQFKPLSDGHLEISHITAAAWSLDGRQIATGEEDGTLRFWDANSGRQIKSVSAAKSKILSVAWGPQGKQVATGSEDGFARIWDATTFELVHLLDAHDGAINALAWSNDGRLVTGSAEGVVKVWILDPNALESSACNYVTRNLNSPEWKRFIPTSVPYHRTCPGLQ